VSRRGIAVAVVAAATLAGVAVAAFLVGRGDPAPSNEEAVVMRGRPLAVETRILPRVHLFGQPVTAEVTAVYHRGLIREGSVRVSADFEPYTQLSARLDPGGVLGPAGQSRARSSQPLDWPSIEVASRLSPEATRGLAWRAETRNLPAVSYRFDPTLATVVLLGGAGVLVGLALVLLAPLAPHRRHTPVEEDAPAAATPLERALSALEASRNGAVGDRRRTLELLARELGAAGQLELSERARRLAWSKQEPTPEEASGLAGAVRSAVAETEAG
jgi:hypothetical protein